MFGLGFGDGAALIIRFYEIFVEEYFDAGPIILLFVVFL